MRDFSWKYFAMTGDVDAYLLYREIDGRREDEIGEQDDLMQEDDIESLN